MAAADIGVMMDIITEMMSIIITTVVFLTIITIIIIQEEKCMLKEDLVQRLPKDQTMVSEVMQIMVILIMVVSDRIMVRITTKDRTTALEITRIQQNHRITAEDSEITRITAPTVIQEVSGIILRIAIQTVIRTADSGIILPATATLIPTAEDSETVQDQATPLPRIIIQTEAEADLDKTIINKRTNS